MCFWLDPIYFRTLVYCKEIEWTVRESSQFDELKDVGT